MNAEFKPVQICLAANVGAEQKNTKCCCCCSDHAVFAGSCFASPRATIFIALSGNGGCSVFAHRNLPWRCKHGLIGNNTMLAPCGELGNGRNQRWPARLGEGSNLKDIRTCALYSPRSASQPSPRQHGLRP